MSVQIKIICLFLTTEPLFDFYIEFDSIDWYYYFLTFLDAFPVLCAEAISTSPKGNIYSYANRLDIEAALNARFVDGDSCPIDPDYVGWDSTTIDWGYFNACVVFWKNRELSINLEYALLSEEAQIVIARDAVFYHMGYSQDGNGIISSVHPLTGIRTIIPDNTGFSEKKSQKALAYFEFEKDRAAHEASLKDSFLKDDPFSKYGEFHYVHRSTDYIPYKFPEKPLPVEIPDYKKKIEFLNYISNQKPNDLRLKEQLAVLKEVYIYYFEPKPYFEEDQNGVLTGLNPRTGQVEYGRHTVLMYPSLNKPELKLPLPPKPPYGEQHPGPDYTEQQQVVLTYEHMVPNSPTMTLYTSHDENQAGYDGADYKTDLGFGTVYSHDQPGAHSTDRVMNCIEDVITESGYAVANNIALLYGITGNTRYLNDLLPSEDGVDALEEALDAVSRLWGSESQDEHVERTFNLLARDLHEINCVFSTLLEGTFRNFPQYKYIPIQDMLSRHDESSSQLKRALKIFVLASENTAYVDHEMHLAAYLILVDLFAKEYNIEGAIDVHIDTFYSRHSDDYAQPYFTIPLLDPDKFLEALIGSATEVQYQEYLAASKEYDILVTKLLSDKNLTKEEIFKIKCRITEILPKLSQYDSKMLPKNRKFKK
jgi:hypothetical protein